MSFLSHVQIPALSAVYIIDGRLPDVGADYTPIARPRRHAWTSNEKQILHILTQGYGNDSPDLWEVFKSYFAEKYRREPKPRRSAWEAMKSHISHPSRYRVWWSDRTSLRVKYRLGKTALSIGIRLQPKVQNTLKSPASRRKQRLPSPATSISSASELNSYFSSCDSTDEELYQDTSGRRSTNRPITPKAKQAEQNKLVSGLLTPPPTRTKSRVSNKLVQADVVVPPIAFRGKSSWGRNR